VLVTALEKHFVFEFPRPEIEKEVNDGVLPFHLVDLTFREL
jgi:hypothetical protein